MSATTRAALWMIGAITCFSTMALAGRAVSIQLDTFELMMFRSLFGLMIMGVVMTVTQGWHEVTFDHFGLHILRNLSHFSGQNLWFFAVSVIPLAQVFSLEFTAPLWVAALAPLILKERLSRRNIIAAGFGFLGILVMTWPELGSGQLSPGMMAAALCAIGFALSAIFTRQLTRTQTTKAILFWLCAMQLVFGVIGAGYDGDITLPSFDMALWVMLIGAAGLFAHTCLTQALSLAPASIVMPIDFVRLPLIAIIGVLVYSEPIGWPLVIGAALVICANFVNLRPGLRQN